MSAAGKTVDKSVERSVDKSVEMVNQAVELAHRLQVLKKVKAVRRRSFERYETEDGEAFFVEVGTEESVWDLPADGEVVQ